MKKTIYVVCIVLMLSLVACSSKVTKTIDGKDKVVVKHDDTTIVATEGKDDWCGEGSTWDMDNTDGSASMVVVGIESSGKYKGYCHVTYDIETGEDTANIDFYFDEDGNGYQVMDINGEKIEQTWSN